MKLLAPLALLSPLALSPLTPVRATPAVGCGDPNILMIVLDDVGLDQLQCFDADPLVAGLTTGGGNLYDGLGGSSLPYAYAPTPNITALAADGVRFTNAFASPLCTPTRSQILTGRYPFRTDIGGIISPNGKALKAPFRQGVFKLSDGELTLPEMMSLLAPTYHLGYFGKWHLVADECRVRPFNAYVATGDDHVEGDDHPVSPAIGWDVFRGIVRNPSSSARPTLRGCPRTAKGPDPISECCSTDANYTSWFYVESDTAGPYAPCGDSPDDLCIPEGALTQRTYETEFITTHQRKALQEWIVTDLAVTDNPFLAVWATTACHAPFDWAPSTATDADGTYALHGYPLAANTDDWARYLTLLASLDAELGRLKDKLTTLNGTCHGWDNTVVILVGDNGTPKGVVKKAPAGSMSPYDIDGSRFKGSPYVSGSGVPLIISGPTIGGTKGRVDDTLVDMVDLFTTVGDLAGATAGWTTTGAFATVTIDGVSLIPDLLATGDSGRVESLSMAFEPNAWVDLTESDKLDVGYVRRHTDGDLYHLVKRRSGAGSTLELFNLDTNRAELGGSLPLSGAAYDALVAGMCALIEPSTGCP